MSQLPNKILDCARRELTIESLFESQNRDRFGEETHGDERRILQWYLPPWQRPEVWEIARKQAFVEGIFLGLGTGSYVVHEMDWDNNGRLPMSGWLIDGQQRLTALRDFVAGDLMIFGGLRYADLSVAEARRRFLHVVFPCFQLQYQPDEQRLRELYRRLNFGGVAHTQTDLERLEDQPLANQALRDRARG